MLDFAKRGLYVGLGLAYTTKEKVEAFAKEFAARSKLSEEEGRKLAEYLQAESKKASESLKETVEQLVQKAAKRLPCDRRFQGLEARLAALEKAAGIASPPPAEPSKCCCGDQDEAAKK